MPEEHYDKEFPNLRAEGWQRTSEPANYNCIAFAAGDTTRYWWPNLFHPDPYDDYWPASVPHVETVEAFIAAFATCGYSPCNDGQLEADVEKVAIYAIRGAVKHAALQQLNGK